MTAATAMVTEVSADMTDGQTALLRIAAAACARRDPAASPEAFVREARRSASCLPAHVTRALRMFRDVGNAGGALLVRGLPVFDVPDTPATPQAGAGLGLHAEGVLGIAASVLGEPIGYRPEAGGALMHNVVPAPGLEDTQQSAGSRAELWTHVELAFASDAYRPDWVLLLCLRADHDGVAGTTVSPVGAMTALLDQPTLDVLWQPRYETTVDQSFLAGLGAGSPIRVGPIRVLSGDPRRPLLRVDFAETSGTDATAQRALERLRAAAEATAAEIRLREGDLLVIDNKKGATHGRTPFARKGDGRDRWLKRCLVVRDLAPSAPYRPGGGRVVDVDYAAAARPAPAEAPR